MNTLFLDIETTGLPDKGANWETDFRLGFPHIVSISWIFQEQVYDCILNQEGRTIPDEAIKIHGITSEVANKSEYFANQVLPIFIDNASQAEVIVGHNLYFDISIVKANLLRLYEHDPDFASIKEYICSALAKEKRIDTMQKSTKYCDIKVPGTNRIKWPSLVELHHKLFEESFDAHQSKNDVIATRRCYFELKKRGVL
jgi:DNA polymerase III epsilon subunit-like protein